MPEGDYKGAATKSVYRTERFAEKWQQCRNLMQMQNIVQYPVQMIMQNAVQMSVQNIVQ